MGHEGHKGRITAMHDGAGDYPASLPPAIPLSRRFHSAHKQASLQASIAIRVFFPHSHPKSGWPR